MIFSGGKRGKIREEKDSEQPGSLEREMPWKRVLLFIIYSIRDRVLVCYLPRFPTPRYCSSLFRKIRQEHHRSPRFVILKILGIFFPLLWISYVGLLLIGLRSCPHKSGHFKPAYFLSGFVWTRP